MGQDAAFVMNNISGADHSAGTAGKTFIGENKGTVFRNLDGTGRANLFAKAATDAAHLAIVLTTGILVGAENDHGIILYAQMDDALGTGQVTGPASNAFAFIHLGDAVGIEEDGAETTGFDAVAAAGAAIVAEIVALGAFVGASATVTVDAGDLGGEFFSNDHNSPPSLLAGVGCAVQG